jgi:predicted RNase H-like HicB family nuclease
VCLEKARQIASGYRFILRPSDNLGYVGRTLELPLVLADGRTPEECLRATMFAVQTAIATMLESGQTPPASASRRTEQINIRLTSEEKVLLEEECQRKGFRGLSDFVRATALAEASGAALPRR